MDGKKVKNFGRIQLTGGKCIHVFDFLPRLCVCVGGGRGARNNSALQFRRPCRQMAVDPQMDLRKVVRNLRLKLCARTVPGPSLVGSWGGLSPPPPPHPWNLWVLKKKRNRQFIAVSYPGIKVLIRTLFSLSVFLGSLSAVCTISSVYGRLQRILNRKASSWRE